MIASPTSQKVNTNTKRVVTKRDQRPSCKVAMEKYLNSIDCPLLFASLGSWEDKWAVFQQAILTGIDIFMSAKKVRVCSAHAPWMTPRLKNLIRKISKCLYQLRYEFYCVQALKKFSKPGEENLWREVL